MPRVKLERLIDNPNPRKQSPLPKPAIVEAIGSDLAPAIVPSIPVTNTLPVKEAILPSKLGPLKKLAGTPFLVDVESGLVYLDDKIRIALKNN